MECLLQPIQRKKMWYKQEFAIGFPIWGCFKKVIMIDNQQKWLSQPHLEKKEQKKTFSVHMWQQTSFAFIPGT